ncbi:hypothetical protein C8J57DRAFT_1721512 [Mycena rebaudengoi]|nr:hypothetical protein C8J57DRAFT_1721512 [Mycena rebaudengoi]
MRQSRTGPTRDNAEGRVSGLLEGATNGSSQMRTAYNQRRFQKIYQDFSQLSPHRPLLSSIMQSVVDTQSSHPTINSAAKQFKLICADDERSMICSLSIYSSELDPEWEISFAVEVTSQITAVTAERLEVALLGSSVRILDGAVNKEQIARSLPMQALVRELATLWIDSAGTVQRPKIFHRSTASKSSFSSNGSYPRPSTPSEAESSQSLPQFNGFDIWLRNLPRLSGDDPSVDILLPVCKEPLEILEHLETASRSTRRSSDSTTFAARTVGTFKKAGNLRHSFNLTLGELFDADFCPRHDFLQEIPPLMRKEPDITIVQTPQFFRPCDEQTWVEQGGSATQELSYRVIQVNRDHWGAAICVDSKAVYRREALKDVGAYFSQQMRWCPDSTTLLSNPEFWKSKLTIVQKLCFLTGMLFYTASAAGPVEFEAAAWVPIAIASLLVTNTGYPSLGEAVSGRATSRAGMFYAIFLLALLCGARTVFGLKLHTPKGVQVNVPTDVSWDRQQSDDPGAFVMVMENLIGGEKTQVADQPMNATEERTTVPIPFPVVGTFRLWAVNPDDFSDAYSSSRDFNVMPDNFVAQGPLAGDNEDNDLSAGSFGNPASNSSPSDATPPPSASATPGNSPSLPLIIGGVAGGIVLTLLAAAALYVFCRRRRTPVQRRTTFHRSRMVRSLQAPRYTQNPDAEHNSPIEEKFEPNRYRSTPAPPGSTVYPFARTA